MSDAVATHCYRWHLDRPHAEAILALLEEAGITAMVEDEQDEPIFEQGELWSRCVLTAYPTEEEAAAMLALVQGQGWPEPEKEPIPDLDWQEVWKEHFPPLPMGERLLVIPTWLEVPPAFEGRLVIRIDPQQAFGTGGHETTHLCLEAIETAMAGTPAPKTVLDFGAGSGVLGIAAALLGANGVTAIDIDPVATETAQANAELNGVTMHCATGNTPPTDRFDLVIANILAGPLVELAAPLAATVAPGGQLVLSGVLNTQAEEVAGAYLAQGMVQLGEDRRGDWWCGVFAWG